MKLISLQWNIGGGRIREKDSDPAFESSYSIKDLNYFSERIRKFDPQVIVLQETHKDQYQDQGGELAKILGFKHFVTDSYDKSHIEEGQMLSQSVLSQFPIISHTFSLFSNPKYRLIRPNGKLWVSHDKGISMCSLQLPNGKVLDVFNIHMIPFKLFDVDLHQGAVQKIFNETADSLAQSKNPLVFQGDFNLDYHSLKDIIPGVFAQGLEEVIFNDPTTPNGRRYDHALYRGIRHIESSVITDTLADHFPIVSLFEVPE